MPRTANKLPSSYPAMLEDIKSRIHAAQIKAALSVNRELIGLYWDIGKLITVRQKNEGWGKSIVERLSADLRNEFPQIVGFSPRNIWRMRSFYLAWTEEFRKLPQAVAVLDGENLPLPVAEIPWGHNILLLEKLKSPSKRLWYTVKTKEFGWSRAVLTHQIESDLYGRQGKAITNFPQTLPAPQSDLANQLLKDPYHLDLLFYHLHLRCYFVIDLKVEEFKPEFAGK